MSARVSRWSCFWSERIADCRLVRLRCQVRADDSDMRGQAAAHVSGLGLAGRQSRSRLTHPDYDRSEDVEGPVPRRQGESTMTRTRTRRASHGRRAPASVLPLFHSPSPGPVLLPSLTAGSPALERPLCSPPRHTSLDFVARRPPRHPLSPLAHRVVFASRLPLPPSPSPPRRAPCSRR